MKSKVLLSGAVALAMATAVMGPVATKSVNVYAAETTQNQQATQNQETTKNVEASKNVLTGKCGDNATYTYDKDAKTIVVSGTGAMWDDMEILGNYDSVKSITIEDGITCVGENAFSTLSVESIKIGKDVQTIKRKAFGFVWGEETTIIPANVKTIEQNAFATIKNIEFMGDIDGFENGIVESNTDDINSVILHGTATKLGMIFKNSPIYKVIIAQDNTKSTFDKGCILSADKTKLNYYIGTNDKVVIAGTVEEIDAGAFRKKSVKSVKLGENVKNIGEQAFYRTYDLASFVSNKKLAYIGDKAFANSTLKKFAFDTKPKMGEKVFSRNSSITYSKGLKKAGTSIEFAKLHKKKYTIRFAKVNGATGYEVKFKSAKYKKTFTTKKNVFTKAVSKNDVNKMGITNGIEEDGTWTAGTVMVRPYKVGKKKKIYGKWSTKTLVLYYE